MSELSLVSVWPPFYFLTIRQVNSLGARNIHHHGSLADIIYLWALFGTPQNSGFFSKTSGSNLRLQFSLPIATGYGKTNIFQKKKKKKRSGACNIRGVEIRLNYGQKHNMYPTLVISPNITRRIHLRAHAYIFLIVSRKH